MFLLGIHHCSDKMLVTNWTERLSYHRADMEVQLLQHRRGQEGDQGRSMVLQVPHTRITNDCRASMLL